MKSKISIAACLALLLSLSAGCSDNDMLPEDNNTSTTEQPMQGVVRVPITIALGGSGAEEGGRGSRVAPPGTGSSGSGNSHVDDKDDGLSETKGVNAVRVVAFRRRTSEETEDFEYDPKNNILLENLVEKDIEKDDYYEGQPHKHLVATGNVSISEGYDYRIVAIAYNKDEKAPYPYYGGKLMVGANMLNLYNGTTYNDFCAKFAYYMVDENKDKENNWADYLKKEPDFLGDLFPKVHNVSCLTRRLATIPQLFFGTIHIKDDATRNPIISYTDFLPKAPEENTGKTDPSVPSLTGTLYRGMAEVEVKIKSAAQKTSALGKNTNPEWYCLLADNVLTKVGLCDYDDFNHGSEPVENTTNEADTYGTYTAVAYQKCEVVGDIITLRAYLLPTKTHLAVRVGLNAKPFAKNRRVKAKDVSFADTATGVIVVDALNDVFYLRRNHKYVFNYTSDKVDFYDEAYMINDKD
ncbi:hypothetical protein [uncultured Prevotella sp.]|uniref:hypothetical protein n=1 Tax=uncultured Prevotella sp. TaxID=159272 RepID=UPI0027E37CD8|nr:hypothetical protein [uncultured Prevotella sp.]